METSRTIRLEGISDSDAMAITGSYDRNLKALSQAFETEISFRDNTFFIKDCDEETYEQITKVLTALAEQAKNSRRIFEQDVNYAARLAKRGEEIALRNSTAMSSAEPCRANRLCPAQKDRRNL